jgi:multiple sugar transport system substrate-binding protein
MKVVEKNKILIIALFVALSFAIGMYPIVIKNKIGNSDKSASNTLNVYVAQLQGKTYPLLQACIDNFKKKYPNVSINEITINANDNEYSKKLLADSLAGNGPDVLYFDPEQLNVHTMQKSKVLEDLKPFIKKDKDFKTDDYNKAVLNAGEYNNQLTFIPLDYYVNSYITTDKLLSDNGVQLKDNMSQNDFIESVSKYISSINGNKSRTLFAYPISITNWIENSGIDFIDYENKKAYFDKPEFRKVIDNYKKIYNSSPKQCEITATSGDEGYDAIKNGSTLFSSDRLFLNDMLESEFKIKAVTGATQVINSIPTYNGGDKVIAMAGECMAINKSSINKQSAYNFIKTALTTKMELKSYGTYVPLEYIPANKKSREEMINRYWQYEVGKNISIDKKGGSALMSKPSTEVERYYNNITQNIEKTETYDPTLDDLMMTCLTPYFNNEETYDSAINTLQQKVKIYLSE